jgi:hypothetical protein
MSKVVELQIKPKEVTHEYEGQKYSCKFDPNAPTDRCWVWHVKYIQTYNIIGNAPTLALAVTRAQRKIHSMNSTEG